MILDQQNIFSDKQDLAEDAGSYLSTNVVDVGKSGDHPRGGVPVNDPGRGGGAPLLIQVVEDFLGGTTVQVQFVNDDDPEMGTPTVIAETAAIPVAQLKAGYQFALDRIPAGTRKRYAALRYVLVGNFTAGKITAGVTTDIQSAPPV